MLASLLQFCIVCRDGAASSADNTLYMCDFCPRIMCRLCMELPPGLEDMLLQENVSFKWICCHISMQEHGRARSEALLCEFFYLFLLLFKTETTIHKLRVSTVKANPSSPPFSISMPCWKSQ